MERYRVRADFGEDILIEGHEIEIFTSNNGKEPIATIFVKDEKGNRIREYFFRHWSAIIQEV